MVVHVYVNSLVGAGAVEKFFFTYKSIVRATPVQCLLQAKNRRRGHGLQLGCKPPAQSRSQLVPRSDSSPKNGSKNNLRKAVVQVSSNPRMRSMVAVPSKLRRPTHRRGRRTTVCP